MKTDMNVRETLGRYILADGLDLVMDLERSHGSWIVDQRDASEYLDLYTMYASQAIGYNHPGMLEISDELARAATQKPICSDVYTEQMARFMEVFARVAMPSYLPHAFFIEGGALAVENALKAAFDWKTRLNLASGKDDARAAIVGQVNAVGCGREAGRRRCGQVGHRDDRVVSESHCLSLSVKRRPLSAPAIIA